MEFNVADMACGGCASAISRAIANMDPTAKVQIDVATKTVKVESSMKQEQIGSVIKAAGFHPVATAP
ncbi:copper chaperone [Paraburkholderia sp. UYCP14C]|uniref:heavy-metal-associated domain-containing protein n=1 Tax=Paraburkholderia sp. UYCP14C TaxID=2511130 RepID=UPI00102194DC|nr:heavy-metal-associated domain-containing protein [Paraburkholderia sp. UYCP14C]RZF27962.1 copper chaperone [Paraburkholderia sp. UYCP14C]